LVNENNSKNINVTFLGTYPPRECGIGTFTKDLSKSTALNPKIIAIDNHEKHNYPEEVSFVINQNDIEDYKKAAEFLNLSCCDLVCIQHEYGIFGGRYGAHLKEFLKYLKKPVVMTMHTVLQNPEEEILNLTKSIVKSCNSIVVLAEKAKKFLIDYYDVPEKKISVILHGVPDVGFMDSGYHKDKFQAEGRTVLLTFGFLSKNKGMDIVIKALPKLVEKYPKLLYIIQGITHPNVVREEGEVYREYLQSLVKELNLENNVKFINEYYDLEALNELISISDIYITPYKSREQISSGTLAYAVGAGKAIVSTPYFCAQELLADGRGVLFNFDNSEELSLIIDQLINCDKGCITMRKKAYDFGREMLWEKVGHKYSELFNKIKIDSIYKNIDLNYKLVEIPKMSFEHLKKLTDDVAIVQHSRFSVPNRHHGYSVDDSSRVLPLLLSAYAKNKDGELLELARTCLSFINHAQKENGQFYNFMSYDRRFVDEEVGEDTQGRVLWGLGSVIYTGEPISFTHLSNQMFQKLIPSLSFTHPQAMAYAINGYYYYLKKFDGVTFVKQELEKLADKLVQMYEENSTSDWQWFEQTITYGRAKISHALLLAYEITNNERYKEIGLKTLDFLSVLCIQDNMLSIIGNKGWYEKGGEKPEFDQQPIDAGYFVDAFAKAYELTKNKKYKADMYISFEWFLGNNITKMPLVNLKSGSCCDGISEDGINANKGAESTIAYLSALNTISNFKEDLFS